MTTVSAGKARSFIATADGQMLTVFCNGGSTGQIIDQNGASIPIGPTGTRRSFGPLEKLQTVRVAMQAGECVAQWSGGFGADAVDGARSALLSNVYNLSRSTMAGLVTASAKAAAGQRGRVLFIGDSTTAGAGAGGTGAGASALIGARAKNYPTRLAALLTAAGINCTNDHFWCSQRVTDDAGVTYQAYDPRMGSFTGAAWSTNALGGQMLLMTTSGQSWSFTPPGTCDGVTIFYARVSGGGSASINVDGGASLGTINANGASAVLTQSYTFTRGAHTLNVASTVSGNFFVLGVLFTDSTVGAIDFIQAGHYGGTTNVFAANTQPWDPVNVAGTLAPDHAFYELGINDAVTGLSLTVFERNVRTMVDRLISVGSSVSFIVNVPFSPASEAIRGNAEAIRAKVLELASQYGAAVFDTPSYWGAHPSDANGGSLVQASWYFDTLHPTALGYSDKAQWIARAINSLSN